MNELPINEDITKKATVINDKVEKEVSDLLEVVEKTLS